MEGKRLFFDSVFTSLLVSVIVAISVKVIMAYEWKRSPIGFDFEWLIVFTAFAVCFFGLSVFAAPLYYCIRKLPLRPFLKIAIFNSIGILFVSVSFLNAKMIGDVIFLSFLAAIPLFTLMSEWVSRFQQLNHVPE
ncbi:hypothetical protein M3212_03885 [Alkalihalobacillus oceani]|uniref:hypothetical protein n=1 Tax=Halalkalibacter oceani TaxID=1653776 RepID=UPI00203F3A89|nr:hypothetical protein [Halalkalibacter oceani]MCM3759926.1 hypothetical protein [Halalkalibacter oceani]